MATSTPAAWFSGIAAPLTAKFGGDVTLSRTGNVVCWNYDGQATIVEFDPQGMLRTTFIDSERPDAVSGGQAAAAYRTGAPYTLNARGCNRMVADMIDFFSGVREPKFTFVDAYPR